MFYTLVLFLHSWLRWVALGAGIAALGASFSDKSGGDKSSADRWGLIFMAVLDLQMLLGLLLYLVLGPFSLRALDDIGASMRTPMVRFFIVEHPVMMFGAIVLVHVGRVLARRAVTPEAKRTRRLAFFGIAMVFMLLSIPWPGTPGGRPLFRL